jgi:hypothetical protein
MFLKKPIEIMVQGNVRFKEIILESKIISIQDLYV